MNQRALLDALARAIGQPHVLTHDKPNTDLSRWERDWRGRAHGRALAVVQPQNTEEVAAVVKACAAHGASIVPQGGNTGLVVGSVPDGSGQQVVLSTTRLNRVRELDSANRTLTVEAGCVLQTVQDVAREAGFLFPLSLAAQGSCTIGGNLATNAGGTQVLRYGNTRDLCLGLEVVSAEGEVWHGLTGLRKDNTGYDLRHLMIGSEGSLGIITAASLKLFDAPAAQLTAWASVPSLSAAVDLLGLAQRRLGAALTGFEVMGQFALSLVDKHFPQLRVPAWANTPYAVLLELSDTESVAHAQDQLEQLLAQAWDMGSASDAIVASNLAQAQGFWHVRESISMAQAEEGLNIKHDISLPISRIPAFCTETDARLGQRFAGVRIVNFGHLGDGNLHYNVQAPLGMDPAVFLSTQEAEVNALVFEQVRAFGGSISAEHGIGSLKAHTLPEHKDPVALDWMHRIKAALDPHQRLNPGRVLLADQRYTGTP
jgi:FAD/FMN-containing dehydrogenase